MDFNPQEILFSAEHIFFQTSRFKSERGALPLFEEKVGGGGGEKLTVR